MMLTFDTVNRVSSKLPYKHYAHVLRNTPLFKTSNQHKVTLEATVLVPIVFHTV